MKEQQPRITSPLLAWFDQFGRKNLPWQKNITPYRVWLSEIMLQQTQVATVIPYFKKFTEVFPTIASLAQADLNEVLHLWTGLGYYARARNLHKTAKIISEQYNGTFPNTLEKLMNLPGIGRSTAGAILSIAFQQAAPILDGNVKRVLCRYHAIAGTSATITKELWQLAEEHTAQERCRAYTQAIMDLGATVCTRSNPNCAHCPLNSNCRALKENKVQELPSVKKKANLPIKTTRFLIIKNAYGQILLQQRPLIGLWGGLWTFPECDHDSDLENYCHTQLDLKIIQIREATTFRHTFSHFHLDITPIYLTVKPHTKRIRDDQRLNWWHPEALPEIGLSAPVMKLLRSL